MNIFDKDRLTVLYYICGIISIIFITILPALLKFFCGIFNKSNDYPNKKKIVITKIPSMFYISILIFLFLYVVIIYIILLLLFSLLPVEFLKIAFIIFVNVIAFIVYYKIIINNRTRKSIMKYIIKSKSTNKYMLNLYTLSLIAPYLFVMLDLNLALFHLNNTVIENVVYLIFMLLSIIGGILFMGKDDIYKYSTIDIYTDKNVYYDIPVKHVKLTNNITIIDFYKGNELYHTVEFSSNTIIKSDYKNMALQVYSRKKNREQPNLPS